jgi:hypothetical protein
MYARYSEPKDLDGIISLIMTHDKMYGMDIIENGLRERHINSVHQTIVPTTERKIIVAVDDDETVLGMCLQVISKRAWLLRYCYIRSIENRNQFNASKIGGLLLEKLCESGEEAGVTDFYYAVRDSGTKRLNLTLSATETVGKKYEFIDIEHIPPLTKTSLELVEKHILSLTNGMNKKPIVIRKGYLK